MNALLRILLPVMFLLACPALASAQAPALSPIANITVNADAVATVNVVATDASGRQITLTSSLPSFATLNSPTIGIGQVVTTLSLEPSAIDIGTYSAAVMAMADGQSTTRIFEITVNAAGSEPAPVVTSPALRETATGMALSFAVSVSDPAGAGIASLDASPLPPGATFTPNASNTSGTFAWTPGPADDGAYDVQFTATSTGGLTGGSTTHIRVEGPATLMIDPIDDVTVEGGSFASVAVDASGLPGQTINLTASLPSFASLNPPGSGIGSVNTTISINPPPGSAGTYQASVTAISGVEFVTEDFDIIVTGDGGPTNTPPTLSAPAVDSVMVGETSSFVVTAADPDGDAVTLFGSALPTGASFMDNGDNTGTFTWTPAANQVGDHVASFTGLDGRGGSGAASTLITVIGETEENLPPVLSAPAALQVQEGGLVNFVVAADDPDGDPVMLTADGVPMGATFVDQGNDTALFSWTPDAGQAGVYIVAFTGNDGRGGSGTASTEITVTEPDQPGECLITGALEFCSGDSTQLCGPVGALRYDWTGPNGFAADTPCITVDAAGLYELTVIGADQSTSVCSVTVSVLDCDSELSNCPRGLGFWKQQCAQRGNGSTKFDRAEMDQITACVDDSSDLFEWENDFDGFCSVIDPALPTDIRKQTLRMYATMLANVCAGRLGIVPWNGEPVSLDPATSIECDLEGVQTIADLMAVAETQLAELEGLALTGEVRAAYGRLKDCIEDVNEGRGIGATCVEDHGTGDEDRDEGEENRDEGAEDRDEGEQGDGLGGNGDDADDLHGLRIEGLNPDVSPNPTNPSTELSFHLSREGRVRVKVYDVQGRLVRELMDEHRNSGEQRVTWDGSDQRGRTVPSGVYFLHIVAPEGQESKRVTVLK